VMGHTVGGNVFHRVGENLLYVDSAMIAYMWAVNAVPLLLHSSFTAVYKFIRNDILSKSMIELVRLLTFSISECCVMQCAMSVFVIIRSRHFMLRKLLVIFSRIFTYSCRVVAQCSRQVVRRYMQIR